VAERVETLTPWTTGSDREVSIRGRHSRQFYRFADKLLGTEVELERLRNQTNPDLSTVAGLQAQIAEARAGLHKAATEVKV
jgi:anaerobic magnesium-protoporphyrin IX monomethyl ester cyclase